MKKLLITGGAGLVGKYLTQDLAVEYEVAIADIVKPNFDVKFYKVDVTESNTLKTITESFDAILHLAGIPHPLNDPPEKIFYTNTCGTFNIMQFAAQRGVRKVVLASSESTLGFAFAARPLVPLYFPIDEQHPLEPQDAYGLSKLCAEEIMKSFSRAHGVSTVALRFPWIWVPEDKERATYRKLVSDYKDWYKNLWAWVGVHDVSQAFIKAIKHKSEGFDRFFITADENWTGLSSQDLIREFYKGTQIVQPMEGSKSLISNDLAKVVLKYLPRDKVSDIFK
ncbi:MAG: NAD(P)-dependent oxidoreductase [Candidatus Kryptoniota bacterium]